MADKTSSGKPPAIQFYGRDWTGDAIVRGLTKAQRAEYMDLLCFMWEARYRDRLPDDDDANAVRLHMQIPDWQKLRERLLADPGPLFIEDGWLVSRRLRKQAIELAALRIKRSDAAKARWACKRNASAYANRDAKGCSSSASSSALTTTAPAAQASDEPSKTSPPKGGTQTQTPGAGSTEAPPRQPIWTRDQPPPPKSDAVGFLVWELAVEAERTLNQVYPPMWGRDKRLLKPRLKQLGRDVIQGRWRNFLKECQTDDFRAKHNEIKDFCSNINGYAYRAAGESSVEAKYQALDDAAEARQRRAAAAAGRVPDAGAPVVGDAGAAGSSDGVPDG